MPTPPDDVLLNKAAVIERCIRRMLEEHAASPDLSNITRVDAMTLNIERACQAAIDMAMHVVSVRHLGVPQSSAEAFDLIHKSGLIHAELAAHLKGMTGFRNIAIHQYQDIDDGVLIYIATKGYRDFVSFCGTLGVRIEVSGLDNPGSEGRRPCVFFDRDGIVNVAPTTRYVEKLSDFELQQAFFDALKVVLDHGHVAAIVTNQKGVSTGHTPREELEAMHDHIRAEVDRRGLQLLEIFYCDATEDTHPRRKPNPGMLIEAAEKHGIDLSKSWMIGDNESDVLTGQRAGCRTIFVGNKNLVLKPDQRVPDMDQLAELLTRVLPSC